MRTFFTVVFTVIFLQGCISIQPDGFSYPYQKEYTGLDTLININGCYMTQRECDSAFFSVFMFYPDGLFTVATGTELSEVVACFNKKSGNKNICKYPSWGTYRIAGNTIRTQTIRDEGITMSVIFRDYLILPDKKIINISEYVCSGNTRIGYLKNYPSFQENRCPGAASFHSLENKKDSADCPFLKKKWFYRAK